MPVHVLTPLGFDQLSAGDEWASPRRTITEADVVNFAGISGDYNPIHVDHESARDSPFGKPVAHGLLGLAVASGLGSFSPKVDTLAFLGILEWYFREPIFFGDTVQLISHIESLEPRARGRRGVVTWQKRLVNQHGKVVQEGRLQTLVKALWGLMRATGSRSAWVVAFRSLFSNSGSRIPTLIILPVADSRR